MAPQYTAKMRTFMAVEYNKRAGTRDFVDGIIQDFVARYPGRAPPSQRTILCQAKKLDSLADIAQTAKIFDFFLEIRDYQTPQYGEYIDQ